MNKKQTGWFAGILLLAQISVADVINGDFESFTNNLPDSWTTIDSGISVSQSTTAYQGSSAVSIVVNTGTQSSTDFLQSIAVRSGESYDFSVWVYHTEGNVRARLIVDGYQSFSDNQITHQWQQLSYHYTASSNGSINVGLRFYDEAGFDGSEEVIVDLFEPTSGNPSCANNLNVSLLTDNYGSETSWTLMSGSTQIGSGNGYSSNTQYSDDFCLSNGNYVFTIQDEYGDGICCNYGSGNYQLTVNGTTLASGGQFNSVESVSFTLPSSGSGNDYDGYYENASGLTGYALKTALHAIISNHSTQSYSSLWTFFSSHEKDNYYENDGTILDIYSENPSNSDPYNYTATNDQCGTYVNEGDCYNREHAFPRAWFGGAVAPMNTDIHHIFATDGKVNSYRSNYPFGTVGSASFTSRNGSQLGFSDAGLGYSGTVFEPIDEFKGDLARAYFYMATRYQNEIGNWEKNTTNSDAVLNGTSDQVFENWLLVTLKKWHGDDPVSQKEIDRNDAAYAFQNNRNPFVDHPEFVTMIWGD